MSEFVFLAVPNIEGMRFLWYLKVIGSMLVFGISLFFLLFALVKFRKKSLLALRMRMYDREVCTMEYDLLVQKISRAAGSAKVGLFIAYLEKFVTTAPYATIAQLLIDQGFAPKEANICERVLYTDDALPAVIAEKIDTYCSEYTRS